MTPDEDDGRVQGIPTLTTDVLMTTCYVDDLFALELHIPFSL